MSRDNQTNLFLNLDDYIGVLLSTVQDSIPYDHRYFLMAILRTEATELLVESPGISPDFFYSVVKALFEQVVDFKKFETLFNPKLIRQYEIPIFLTTYLDEKYKLNVKTLNHYLLQGTGETFEDREKRIESYIDEFVLNFPTGTLFLREPKYVVQSTFVQYIKRLTSDHYFLSDQDLDKFVEWMCEAYNLKIGLFSGDGLASETLYPIQLVTRNVFVKPIVNLNSTK